MKLGMFLLLIATLQSAQTFAKSNETAKEMLISKAEDDAIKAMEKILLKKKGAPDEPDLLFRLAEMHLRKAKTTRYFEMQSLSPNWTPNSQENKALPAGSKAHVEKAAQVLTSVVGRFPKFHDLDGVLFYQGFCHQTLGKVSAAQTSYLRLVRDFPQSRHRFDSWISLGEMEYEAGKFQKAKEYFQNVSTSEEANAAPYAMYKMAWSEYNMKRSDHAFEMMKKLLRREFSNPKAQGFQTSLRAEAVKDLALFFSDHRSSDDVIEEFQSFLNHAELTTLVSTLGNIYSSHSRHKDTIKLVHQSLDLITEPALVADLLLHLAKTYEITKDRKEMIATLKRAQSLCLTSCPEGIPRYVSEQISKGWESIKAGKGHRDFVEDLFVIRLGMGQSTDPTTSLAYAEFLFHVKDFTKSSLQYEIYSDLISPEAKKAKNETQPAEALYSALAAAENMPKENEKLARQEQLADKYLNLYPKGPRSLDVLFLKATLQYKNKQLDQSEKTLLAVIPRALSEKNTGIQEKAEDLVLDIYNQQANYKKLSETAAKLTRTSQNEKRKSTLDTLIQEADFADIPNQKGIAPEKVHSVYFDYYSKHPEGNLAQKAINLSLAHALKVRLLETSQKYMTILEKKYPQDSNISAYRQELALIYLDYGRPDLALEHLTAVYPTWKASERGTKAIALLELGALAGRTPEVLKLVEKDIEALPKSQQVEIIGRTWNQSEEGSPIKAELRRRLFSLGQEPYYSLILVSDLELQSKNKPASDVFGKAKQIVGNKAAPGEARARARMLQARILAQEFYSQSTKTSLDRIATVIALKTEKLAKLQEALESAASLNPTAENVQTVNNSLTQAYEHYVGALSNLTIKDNLSPEETKELKSQLTELTSPILAKLNELKSRDQVIVAQSDGLKFNLENIKASVPPREFRPSLDLKHLSVRNLVLPSNAGSSIKKCLETPNEKLCQTARSESLAQPAFEKESTLVNSIYMIVAGKTQAAFWILSQAIEKAPQYGPFYLVRAFAQKERYPTEDLSKAAELKVENSLVRAHTAATASLRKDCPALEESLTKEVRAAFAESVLQQSECLASEGKAKDAQKVLLASPLMNSLEAQLQAARIAEDFLIDLELARKHYKAAQELSHQMPEIKPWLDEKLRYLNGILPSNGKKPLNSVEERTDSLGGQT